MPLVESNHMVEQLAVQLPTQRSATPFCQGLANEVRTAFIFQDRRAARTSVPYFASLCLAKTPVIRQNFMHSRNQRFGDKVDSWYSTKILVTIAPLRHLLGWMGSREALILENLALRQQLLALHAKRPRRRLTASHKLFWVVLQRLWSGWKTPLILVTPKTVVGWHRAGFRLYWEWLSRARQMGGRKPVTQEVRALIFRMAAENPTWGAPRIHGELLKLGLDLSEPTVSRWLRRAPRNPDPAERWVGSCRRDLLDHVIVLNERHLKRLMAEYVRYLP